MGRKSKKRADRRLSGIGFGKAPNPTPGFDIAEFLPELMPIAGSSMDGYFTEVFLYKQHEIIIRKHKNAEYYEAFIGDLAYQVKAPFADRQCAMDLAKAEVDSLIKSFADS